MTQLLDQRQVLQVLFHPRAEPLDARSPGAVVSVAVEPGVTIGGRLHPAERESPLLLFFHGNGGNLSHRIEKISFFHSLGFNVFIMDYRGYGESSGSPSEQGLYKDAQSSYDYLITALKFKPEQIILFGESLGAAVATEMALKNKVGAVI